MNTYAPFAQPLYVMLKPAGAICNLRCKYCYYLDKKQLYPGAGNHLMSDATLETFIRQYLEAQTASETLFVWHGGEPLMRHMDFYRKALDLQRRYGRGRQIENVLQTNGTLLTDDWCRFFRENNFLIGISIDGPQHCHDAYRRDRQGRPSFHAAMKGLSLLRKHDVEYNAMATVNCYNADFPLDFYRFFKEEACHYIQFSPVVETVDGQPAAYNVPAAKWGNFLTAIFDEWLLEDVGTYYIQYFDSMLANWTGEPPGICTLAKTCGRAGVMEFNGDVYSCDHLVYPPYKLGNIKDNTLTGMMYSERQATFGNAKYDALPQQCRDCQYLFACHGECPKNRILRTSDGEEGLNWLCEGFYRFFEHVAPFMDYMKNELVHQRPPSNVMKWARGE